MEVTLMEQIIVEHLKRPNWDEQYDRYILKGYEESDNQFYLEVMTYTPDEEKEVHGYDPNYRPYPGLNILWGNCKYGETATLYISNTVDREDFIDLVGQLLDSIETMARLLDRGLSN
jgi:hypothetical protein